MCVLFRTRFSRMLVSLYKVEKRVFYFNGSGEQFV
jgi:hypothetical protein